APDGDACTYAWKFGEGTAPRALANPSHTYTTAGTYTAVLTVRDASQSSSANVTITVQSGGPPTATITAPVNGSTYRDGAVIQLRGSATDAKDGTIPDSRLSWQTP